MKSFFFLFIVSLGIFLVSEDAQTQSSQAFDRNLLVQELSSRHPVYDKNSLLTLAGSEDVLVSELLQLRRVSKPPALGVRAEKMLLQFLHREDVNKSLIEDVSDSKFLGLGSIVISSLPTIEDKAFRKTLVEATGLSSKNSTVAANRYRAILNDLPSEFLKE